MDELAPFIGELNFTYDRTDIPDGVRPDGYAKANLRQASLLADAGVLTRAECPLHRHNVSDGVLTTLYQDLRQHGIHRLLLMRRFPVGRGCMHADNIPSPDQYQRAIRHLRRLEQQYGGHEVKLQCALKHLETVIHAENPCDMVRESCGIMPDGTLLASPWAFGPQGRPLHDAWVLGNLVETPLDDLLNSPKARRMAARADENFGHCKMFAFLHST